MVQFDIPERAIGAFECIHHLNITIHDLAGSLSPFLKPNRFHHRSPLCLAVKARGHHTVCFDFELRKLRQDLADLPEGRIHVCHAGLVEWAMPVFEEEKLAWILFAGPRLPGPHLISAVWERRASWPKSPWAKGSEMPGPVGEDEAQLVLEHLRQLAARLQKWVQELESGRSIAYSPSTISRQSRTTRRAVVQRFIEDHYDQPVTLPMLAQKLCLSESRASHVIHECCGASFRELLVQKRLRVAMELLRQSAMSVLEVAVASGFEDVAHFHRLFRRRIGTTPARYRIGGQS